MYLKIQTKMYTCFSKLKYIKVKSMNSKISEKFQNSQREDGEFN